MVGRTSIETYGLLPAAVRFPTEDEFRPLLTDRVVRRRSGVLKAVLELSIYGSADALCSAVPIVSIDLLCLMFLPEAAEDDRLLR